MFYNNYLARYIAAESEQRKAAKAHWVRCYVAAEYDSAQAHAAKMLATIAVADAIIGAADGAL